MSRVKIGNVYPSDEYLLERCAPTGYGLGTTGQLVEISSADEIDTIVSNGWFALHSNTEISIGGYSFYSCSLEVSMLTENFGWHTIRFVGMTSELRRHKDSNGWGEWEWENPPMALGVEYRTTERFMGEPVYTMLFDMGQLANNGDETACYHVNSILCAEHLVESRVILAASDGKEEEAHDFYVYVTPESTIQYGYSGDKSAYTGKLFIKYTH